MKELYNIIYILISWLICSGCMKIQYRITACRHWLYQPVSNSLAIQLKYNEEVPFEFEYINTDDLLPINGTSKNMLGNLTHYDYINSTLYSITLTMSDPKGYCIKELWIKMLTEDGQWVTVYKFTDKNTFGHGIIVSSHCQYSYVHNDAILSPCFDTALQLHNNVSRGIYQVKMHTCVDNEAGMKIQNMKNNVYASITGKKLGTDSYSSTPVTYLDYFAPHDVSLSRVGTLLRSNIRIKKGQWSEPFFSENWISANTKAIGIKIEYVGHPGTGKNRANCDLSDEASIFKYYDDDGEVEIHNFKGVIQEGSFYMRFWYQQWNFAPHQYAVRGICSGDADDPLINIYLIFAGAHEEYQLPFILHHQHDGPITWEAANLNCTTTYGTTLASVHSSTQNKLMYLMSQFRAATKWSVYRGAWIGLHRKRYWGERMYEQVNWEWIDGTSTNFINWYPGEPNGGNEEQCALLDYVDTDETEYKTEWNDFSCISKGADHPIEFYFCNSPVWHNAETLTYEMNVEDKLENITLITVGNNHETDDLCLDSIQINKEYTQYMTNNWIGKSNDSTDSNGETVTEAVLTGIFQFPVCHTQVLGMRTVIDKSQSNKTFQTQAEMECVNNNRLSVSQCSVSQSYSTTTSTTISLSSQKEYSWGHTQGWSWTNTFGFGFTQEIEGGAKIFGFGGKVKVGMHQDYEHSSTGQRSHTESHSESTTSATTYTAEETRTIECTASTDIPPGHKIGYQLVFEKYNATVQTYFDLKLTLCSVYIYDDNTSESNYIYLENVTGEIIHEEATSCIVNFEPAKYIHNGDKGTDCFAEQRQAIVSGSNYIPNCNGKDNKLYDGCQYSIADLKVATSVWCVDIYGNPIPNKVYIGNEPTYQRVCSQVLKCKNSSIHEPTISPTSTPTISPTASPIISPTASPTISTTSSPTMSPTHDPRLLYDAKNATIFTEIDKKIDNVNINDNMIIDFSVIFNELFTPPVRNIFRIGDKKDKHMHYPSININDEGFEINLSGQGPEPTTLTIEQNIKLNKTYHLRIKYNQTALVVVCNNEKRSDWDVETHNLWKDMYIYASDPFLDSLNTMITGLKIWGWMDDEYMKMY